MNTWKDPEDELPSAYQEVEILVDDNIVCRDMIIRNKFNEDELEWKHFPDEAIQAWREIADEKHISRR